MTIKWYIRMCSDIHYSWMQAIEHKSQSKLIDSIQKMEKCTKPGCNGYLDVCYLQCEHSLHHHGKRSYCYMTLLAYAAVKGQKVMVEALIKNKASKSHETHLYV